MNESKNENGIDQSKSIYDFYKTFTGFASASILLVVNFFIKNDMIKILEAPMLVKIFIAISLLCFTICVILGVLTICIVLNKFGEGENFSKYTWTMIITFSGGYISLLFGIGILIFSNNSEICN